MMLSEIRSLRLQEPLKALFSVHNWQFYKFGYDTMLKIALIRLTIIIIMAIAIFVMSLNGNPEPRYFLVNQHNQYIPIEPLYEPARKDEQIRQFATDAILASMNLFYI